MYFMLSETSLRGEGEKSNFRAVPWTGMMPLSVSTRRVLPAALSPTTATCSPSQTVRLSGRAIRTAGLPVCPSVMSMIICLDMTGQR